MAGSGNENGIYYWSNNGIDSNKIGLEDTTAPGFGYGSYLIRFTRPSGKSFIKWNTAADGSGTDYFPGDDVSHLLGQEADLYAIWGDIPLIVQKSSIEEIADTVRGKDITLSNSPQTMASLPDAINSLLCPTGNICSKNIPSTAWSSGYATLSTTPNSIDITNFPVGSFVLRLTLSTSSTGSYSNEGYALIYYGKVIYNSGAMSAPGWQYSITGYGANWTLVISSNITDGKRKLNIALGSGTRYIKGATLFYTELG